MSYCTACHHNLFSQINADIGVGMSDGAVARRYGLGRQSVRRHRISSHAQRFVYADTVAAGSSRERGELVSKDCHPLIVLAVRETIGKRDLEFADTLDWFFNHEGAGVRERFIAALVACGYGSKDYLGADGVWYELDWTPVPILKA